MPEQQPCYIRRAYERQPLRPLLSAGQPVFRQARSGRRRQRSRSSWEQASPSNQTGSSLPGRSSRHLLVRKRIRQGCCPPHTQCPTPQYQPAHICPQYQDHPCFLHLDICVWMLVAWADQRSSTVALASVFPSHSPGAEERVVQLEP